MVGAAFCEPSERPTAKALPRRSSATPNLAINPTVNPNGGTGSVPRHIRQLDQTDIHTLVQFVGPNRSSNENCIKWHHGLHDLYDLYPSLSLISYRSLWQLHTWDKTTFRAWCQIATEKWTFKKPVVKRENTTNNILFQVGHGAPRHCMTKPR